MPQYIQLSLFDAISTKHCGSCDRDLPATLEYWHKAKNKRGEPSLAHECKDCARARAKKWADENPERNRRRARKWAEEHPERVQQNKREYYAENKERFRAYKQEHKAHYLELKRTPKYKAKAAEYRRRKQEERRKYNRAYRAAHPGHYTMLAREDRRRNPERAKAKIHKRIAMKHAAPGEYTADDVKRMYVEQDGMCAYCGIRIYMDVPRDVHVDHVMPLSRGGTNYADNLLLTCQSCNTSKNAKAVDEWTAVRGW